MTDSDAEETTEEAIMQATYRALSKHGYPAMSISKIDDEFEKSKALLYHHYEDKEDLLEHFLKYLLDQLDEDFASIETSDPIEDLHAILDRLLPPDIDEEQMGFQRALLQHLRCQVRDCYIEMGIAPPEEFRVQGPGFYDNIGWYENHDFYQNYYDTRATISDWQEEHTPDDLLA